MCPNMALRYDIFSSCPPKSVSTTIFELYLWGSADDADRAWRFDRVGIALASGWFGQTPDYYTDRLEHEIIPELITEAAIAMAHADLKRSRDLLKTAVLR